MLDKIAKLLAKAEATSNEEEAAAYTAKAEELMVKYGIEEAELAAARGVKPGMGDIVTEHHDAPGDYHHAHSYLAAAVSAGLGAGVRTFRTNMYNRSNNVNGATVWFVGFQQDIDMAVALWRSLMAQADLQYKAWWLNQPERGLVKDSALFRIKREYLLSFGRGAGTKLAEVRNKVVVESAPGTALVLASKSELVDAHMKDNYTLRTGRSLRSGTAEARAAGTAAGREAASGRSLES